MELPSYTVPISYSAPRVLDDPFVAVRDSRSVQATTDLAARLADVERRLNRLEESMAAIARIEDKLSRLTAGK